MGKRIAALLALFVLAILLSITAIPALIALVVIGVAACIYAAFKPSPMSSFAMQAGLVVGVTPLVLTAIGWLLLQGMGGGIH